MDKIEFEPILLRFGATMRAFGKLKSKANKKEQPQRATEICFHHEYGTNTECTCGGWAPSSEWWKSPQVSIRLYSNNYKKLKVNK